MRDLLSVWGDSSAVRHTSVEQHLYITKALFIALGFLKESDKAEIREGKGNNLWRPVSKTRRIRCPSVCVSDHFRL